MTTNQKAFAAWLEKFCETCRKHGGIQTEAINIKAEWPGANRFEFKTKFGSLQASFHHSDYECETKRGFVSIYMRWGNDVDLPELSKHLGGELNRFSGKWNIHKSSDKKNVSYARESAIEELERRLSGVMPEKP